MDAFLAGLEQAKANGHDLSAIDSVASFFVSRVDTEVDKRLDKIGTEEAKALRGKAAIANAQLAYQHFEEVFATDRWRALAAAGAHPQRPLWASTSTKNPDYRDTIYVDELVAPGVVNTMPEPTIDAVADHGEVKVGVIRPPTRGPAGARPARGARHLLRRRHRDPRARGRGEVRGLLGGAAGRRTSAARGPAVSARSELASAAVANKGVR